jgi:hypothetical protein
VTNSFQPQDYSITSSDVVTIDLSDTITLTSSYDSAIGYSAMTTSTGTHNVAIGAGSTYTITAGSGSGGTIAGITAQDISTFTWKMPEEFVDAFPDYDRVKKMCEQYPGLKLAYDKFVTTYKLVRDDYDLPPEKRIKP